MNSGIFSLSPIQFTFIIKTVSSITIFTANINASNNAYQNVKNLSVTIPMIQQLAESLGHILGLIKFISYLQVILNKEPIRCGWDNIPWRGHEEGRNFHSKDSFS